MRFFGSSIAVACLCLMTLAFGRAAEASAPVVWVAAADQGGAYALAIDAMRLELQRGDSPVEVVVKPWHELARLDGPPPRLVVTLGVAAMREFVESGSRLPLLATLLPRVGYLNLAAIGQSGRTQSAIWLDQPAGRQLDLLRLALPSRHRIGVVYGPESRIYENEILRGAAERGLSVVSARIESAEQLSAALQKTLEDSEVLLALPDPQIYNGATIQNVLTSTYRRRIPMTGFSPAYVRAGALLALYSTPTQVGTQVGEVIRGVLAARPLPAPQGPRDFAVSVNADVARSLGIPIDANAAEKWTDQMRAKERAQ
jgi:ABC-type uncharacterized transport system substrate-binding protein